MLHRVRARMRFTASSGLAAWCRDNMAVRYSQAVMINLGEEEPLNEVEAVGSHRIFRCDLPLMDEAHAADAFNTLSDANVLGQSLPYDEEEGVPIPSWVEHHTCDHRLEERSGCVTVSRLEGPS